MHDVKTWLKALLLMPSGFAGAMTAPAFSIPPRTTADVVLPILILSPVYLLSGAVLLWMWRQPPGRRYFEHTRTTWSLLFVLAYGLGFGSMLFLD